MLNKWQFWILITFQCENQNLIHFFRICQSQMNSKFTCLAKFLCIGLKCRGKIVEFSSHFLFRNYNMELYKRDTLSNERFFFRRKRKLNDFIISFFRMIWNMKITYVHSPQSPILKMCGVWRQWLWCICNIKLYRS